MEKYKCAWCGSEGAVERPHGSGEFKCDYCWSGLPSTGPRNENQKVMARLFNILEHNLRDKVIEGGEWDG